MRFKDFVEQSRQFDYSSLANAEWKKILNDAQKESKIRFDTENDGAVTLRDIRIDQDHWDHFDKCKFRCELRKACGDWEVPVAYFRCQLIDGYADIPNQFGSKLFCYIPGQKEGNRHLINSGKKGWHSPDNDCYKSEQEKPDDNLCWKSLKKYLKTLVDKEISNLKSN